MSRNFVNLTPHSINILKKDGSILTITPSGKVARVAVGEGEVIEVEGVEVVATETGELEGLEGLVVEEGAVLITSLAAKEATRAAFPHALVTSPRALIRGADGQPIGCQGLAR